ncbi:MAG: hypothetical protein GEU83_19430 [Pseudonocardiaceae bacterium]|nr:hypothetical protein [Pseudonocardiaceae bacterium]
MDDGSEDARQSLVHRLTTRAWHDEVYRELLFNDAHAAILDELGEVPHELRNVRFRRRPVDRARVRPTPRGRRLVVRPKYGDVPLSVVKRQVFGVTELIVVFYTRRCRYQCTFCTLPSTSALSDVPLDDIDKQVDVALDRAGDLSGTRQVFLGNEGSILDARTFPREQLEHVLRRFGALPGVEEFVLETRAEFVTEELIDAILGWVLPARLSVKIGLESVDDHVRENVLRKRMDLDEFEAVVSLLGTRGVGLSSYVLVKADPHHSDEDGKRDALATCRYLTTLCRRTGTRLTLKVNSMYRAANSMWAGWAAASGWVPPSIFDLAEVLLGAAEEDVRVFAGLSEEGLATADGHYEVRSDFALWAQRALEEFNRTGDIALVRNVVARRPPP